MDSYQNPVTPPDPYERYRNEAIDREQQAKRQGWGGDEPPKEKWVLAAYFLSLVRRIVTLLIETPAHSGSKNRVVEGLRSLKAAFEILKIEDRSEDIQFLNHLSKLWQRVLEDALTLGRDSELSASYKAMIKKIQHFPEHQVHTFGYYLSEYAGQKWIPFPYMEMIQKIHSDHEKNPAASALTEWTALIDQVLLKAD
ncbi:MAG TPA: hypothetical protein VLF94_05180 [Chlamydiales bacterium]|nr:hypothetical protein [Chlamydiales bacterium]